MSTYYERANVALDGLGWADTRDPMEVMQAVMDLARLVRDMARELDGLTEAS